MFSQVVDSLETELYESDEEAEIEEEVGAGVSGQPWDVPYPYTVGCEGASASKTSLHPVLRTMGRGRGLPGLGECSSPSATSLDLEPMGSDSMGSTYGYGTGDYGNVVGVGQEEAEVDEDDDEGCQAGSRPEVQTSSMEGKAPKR